ncbi:hypothetical protein OROMI_025914 [Orobanche minor]
MARGLGKKKMQRKARQAEKESAKNGGSSSSKNFTYLPADEWFAKLTEDVLDKPNGIPMDGIMRNMIRMTAEIRTREYGALESLFGKTLVWLQRFCEMLKSHLHSRLVMVDDERLIQGKIHGIGAKVEPKNPNVAQLSRCLFRETAPLLLGYTNRWIFTRTLVLKEHNRVIDEAFEFHSHDPLGGLLKLPVDTPLGTRCTEVFVFLAGDFAVGEGGLDSREAVMKLLHELYTPGFDVVAGSAKVAPEKLAELKGGTHVSLS